MKKNIGVIGCGNMAQAIIGGIVASNILPGEKVLVSDTDEKKLNYIKDKLNVKVTKDNKEIAANSDIIILAIKPNVHDQVIGEIKDCVKDDVVIVTIGAGITINYIEKAFNRDIKVIRTMPNTPALVGEGMAALCYNNIVSKEEIEEVVSIFESFGKVEIISEKLMDVVPAVSGSSPAYVYMFIEALADGAVLDGMPRDKAYKMAAQSVLGAAKMVLETGEHPGALKDKVCSPGGTTIEAVYSLEMSNFRGAVIQAMRKCTEKTIKMSGK
ncbi:Pyrroline-5-carboxylate reductase [Clostridium liquoris]|jgi:pyrroline-5-carboxylate reductase|uniref:Pyrroline-5-carboxylate reductase n=1 Tax=Clostridium liquoris TaxID=1289519 RepID=A0A2T0B568_9CLOT|nr:pyrroline-5-carboxylate reductase [Clostridium liquoris]PRR79034.1 Pyrroline-5-carboxylate reductase [Clostridium liquoris]